MKMPKFNTQFTVEETAKDSFTLCGDSKEILYDLKYSSTGEPYLVPNGKIRDVKEEIQKASVYMVDIATLYERFVSGDTECLSIVCGGEYLDCSVWSKDMIENAGRAYEISLHADSVVTDTANKTEESEGEKE